MTPALKIPSRRSGTARTFSSSTTIGRPAKSLALMLSATGYDEIRTVRSAARALAIATTFQPAIAFLGTASIR